jgi:hypothetical protein
MNTDLREVERRELNGHVVLWFYNDNKVYVCKVDGKIQHFYLFSKMTEWVTKQTGVNYPF